MEAASQWSCGIGGNVTSPEIRCGQADMVRFQPDNTLLAILAGPTSYLLVCRRQRRRVSIWP